MGSRIKRALLSVMCILALCGCVFVVGCSGNDSDGDNGETKYAITLEATENGTITADRTESVAGATVNLTVTPDNGYVLSTLTVNDDEIQSSDGAASFVMPESDVTVKAVFVEFGLYTVDVAAIAHAKVTADKTTVKYGNTVTLNVSVDYGYTLTELKMNGTALTVTDGKATFVMPEAKASVTGATAMVADIQTEATPVEQLSFGSTVADGTAKSYWAAEYGDDGLTVTAYVEDDNITPASDGIELYFGKSGFGGTTLGASNIGVKVTANGDAVYYIADNGYKTADDNGIDAITVLPWSKDGSTVSGYYVRVTVPYTALKFEGGKPADGSITALPVMVNYTNTIGAREVYNGYSIAQPSMYPVLENRKWTENYYARGMGVLGGTQKIQQGKFWNISKDYAIEDTDNYARREARLAGGSDGDNNLLFFRNEGKSVYAEAMFEVSALYNGEKASKFGLMLFDGANQAGVFYFVDANTADKEPTGIQDIKGNALGYNICTGNWGKWNDGIASGAFDYRKPITLKMAYDGDNNVVYMWYVNADGQDVLAARAMYEAKGDVTIGFKSFNTGLSVYNYSCTNDTNSDGFKDHIIEKEESVFFGDSGFAFGGAKWNLENDTEEQNRSVTLTGNDGNDNNLYIPQTEGKAAYVRATFKFNEIYNNEKWGKFGLMFFDGKDQTGTFLYVDAHVGDYTDSVIRGKDLGYNDSTGESYSSNWIAFKNGMGVYDSAKTITLAMTYANNIVSMYYESASGDVLLGQVAHINTSSKYIIGIKSFALGITVTDYYAITDQENDEFKAHNPAIVREDIDTLFAGDSYMEFWSTHGVWNTLTQDVGGAKLVDVGVGGTQVPFWDNEAKIGTLNLMYNPSRIVFHIGVNDMDSGEVTAKQVYDRIANMFANYHKVFPNADLYWVSLIPNNFFIKPHDSANATYNSDYKSINEQVKALAEKTSYLNYIDEWSHFINENGEVKANYLINDGLHLNAIYGYPLWTSVIKKALGFTLEGDDPDYVLGNSGDRYATPAWKYGQNGNIAELDYTNADHAIKVQTEENIYYKAAPSADIFFEAEIRSKGKYYADEWSKIGVSLVNEDITVLAYFETGDSSGLNGANITYASIVARDNYFGDYFDVAGKKPNRMTGVGDWNWDNQVGSVIPARNITSQFSKIGIAKLDDVFYLFVDGEAVANTERLNLNTATVTREKDGGKELEFAHINQPQYITAESKFTAAVTEFNRNVEIRSVRAYTTREEVERMLTPSYTVTAPASVVISDTKAKAGETVNFTLNLNADDVLDHVSVTKDGDPVAVTETDGGKYSFTMPEGNVVISVTLQGKLTVTLGEGVAENITASAETVSSGTTVTFTARSGKYIKHLWYEGENGVKTEITQKANGGGYELVITENVNITGEFYDIVDGIILDGELDDAYGNVSTEALISQNRNMQVWAVKTDSGVFIYAMSHSNMYKDDGTDNDIWWDNSNFEWYLNNGAQSVVTSRGHTQRVTKYKTSYRLINDENDPYNGKWENIYEIYIAKDLIDNFDDDNIQLNYAFKTGNGIDLGGYASVFEVEGAITESYDWWGFHGIGGASGDFWVEYLRQGRPANLFITSDGLYIKQTQAQNGTIDGDLSEFADNVIYTGNATTSVAFSGYMAADGLYLGLTIEHGAWSAETHEDWSWNDNIEIKIDDMKSTIAFMDGRLVNHSSYTQVAKKDVENNGRITTYVELFMPILQENVSQVKLQAGLNGHGFSGWQALIWDRYYANITADGIAPVDLDGEFDDGLWTQSVRDSKITTTVNGASVTTMGVKTTMGVMLGITVVHSKDKDTDVVCDTNCTSWYHYMGPEVRLFGQDGAGLQVVCSAHNLYKQFCYFGTTTKDNGDGKFTTTYEMFIPYYFYEKYSTLGDVNGDIAIALAGVYETGWALQYGSVNWSPTHYVTSSGLRAA